MGTDVLLLATVWASLALYAVLGGADFGAGIWEALTRMRSPADERRLLFTAVSPVWEANHVWLVFAIVLLVEAFPPAFAGLCRALAIPLALALAGIVMRGCAFVYRAYGAAPEAPQRGWGVAFAAASALAPACLGAAAGAVASGSIRISRDGQVLGGAGAIFLGWTPLLCAASAVASCAYLAAVYLVREATSIAASDLVAIWRRRAIVAGIAAGFLAVGGLLVVACDAPRLFEGLRGRGAPAVLLSAGGAVVSFAALMKRRPTIAAGAAAVAVASVVFGWGLAQYPLVVPPSLPLEDARAEDAVLRATAWSVAAGAVLVAPSLAVLFALFKRGSHR